MGKECQLGTGEKGEATVIISFLYESMIRAVSGTETFDLDLPPYLCLLSRRKTLFRIFKRVKKNFP